MAPPVDYTFLEYWGVMAMNIPSLLFSSWNLFISIPLCIIFFVTLLNKKIGKRLSKKWEGISLWWPLIIILVLLLWGTMNVIYQRDKEICSAYKIIKNKYRPSIHATIDFITCTSETQEISTLKPSTLVTLIVSVRNTGSKTGLENWALETILPNGKKLEGILYAIPAKGNTLYFGGDSKSGGIKFAGNNALYQLALNPIPNGAILRGVLMFVIPSIKSEELEKAKIILSFKDVFNHEYQLTDNLTSKKQMKAGEFFTLRLSGLTAAHLHVRQKGGDAQ